MLIAFFKPYGILCQFTPEPGSRWGTLSTFGLPSRVYSLGRLDADSEGLLLLSDEAGLNSRLMDPKHAHEREYWVQVEGIPDEDAFNRLRKGVRISDYMTKPAVISLLPETPQIPPRDPPIRVRKSVPDSWISVALTEGKNRQVRRMTAAVGHPTLRLVRARIGTLTLAALQLGVGEWRELTAEERRQALSSGR